MDLVGESLSSLPMMMSTEKSNVLRKQIMRILVVAVAVVVVVGGAGGDGVVVVAVRAVVFRGKGVLCSLGTFQRGASVDACPRGVKTNNAENYSLLLC